MSEIDYRNFSAELEQNESVSICVQMVSGGGITRDIFQKTEDAIEHVEEREMEAYIIVVKVDESGSVSVETLDRT